MAKSSDTNLYNKIIRISQDYLGPAADRFIARQINTHLKKAPEDLNAKDMPVLIDWIRPTFALLTDDQQLVENFIARLRAIDNNNHQTHRG